MMHRDPMDVLRPGQTVLTIALVAISLVKDHRDLSSKLKNGLKSIKQELEMIEGDLKNYEEVHLQELAYDIEDFIYGLQEPGPFVGFVLNALGIDPRPQEIDRIKQFKESIERLEKRRPPTSHESSQSVASGVHPRHEEAKLVGIDKHKDELLELLSPACKLLRVISIVGFRTVGKTALARAVYDHIVNSACGAFDCVAWSAASECRHAEDILNKIRQEIAPTDDRTLQTILREKRYLVFIDDLQGADMWHSIEHAFPENAKSSRIIVTTSDRSVACACSSRRCSVMNTMQCLGEDDSKAIFWKKVFGKSMEPSPALKDGSIKIFEKCDGLPLALISAANYLCRGQVDKTSCERVGEQLGEHLSGDESAFMEMKRALVQSYEGLPNDDHKACCLLSLSIFPRGHKINRKCLIRRLSAEGLINGDGRKCLDYLINRSIIDPVLIRNDSKGVQKCEDMTGLSITEAVPIQNNSKVVERCHVQSVMLEFIIHKSVSKNFITLVHKDKLQAYPLINKQEETCTIRIRRLAVQSGTRAGWCLAEKKGLSVVRSLTIFDSELVNLNRYQLLRVLDLEGCTGLGKNVVKDICEFRFLRYLNLRNTDIQEVPREIEKLQHLQTLDIRGTKVQNLPMEVIRLPNLVYLFGQFELPAPTSTTNLEDFLSTKSKLHTLAGFVINKTQGFGCIIPHAKRLRKVKAWCKETADPSTTSALTEILVSSLMTRFTDLESVSIDSGDFSKAFLHSLRSPCIISTIKLRGKLGILPDEETLRQLRNLNKLHLFSTGLTSEALSVLQTLPCLEYLKLVEDRDEFGDGRFVVQSEGFPSLQRLCFDAPKLPLVHIEENAMTNLASLQLLCLDFADDGLGVTGIQHLQRLNEVVLHPSVGESKLQVWKDAAIRHNRPYYVKKQKIQ